MFEHIISAAIGAGVAIFIFALQRYVRKDHISESLSRKHLLLDLRKKMAEQKIDSDGVALLEQEFKKSDKIRRAEIDLMIESFDFGIREIEEAETQQGANQAQGQRLEMLENKLAAVLVELERYLDAEGKCILNNVQESWEAYRSQEATWIARGWSGGTMYPFIYAGEKSRLTVERIATLQAELELERKAYSSGL